MKFLLAVAIALSAIWVSTPQAVAQRVDMCALMAVDTYLTDAVDLSPSLTDSEGRPARLSDADYAKAYKDFRYNLKQFNESCTKSTPDTLYNATLLIAWRAWLRHWKGTDGDGVSLEQAIQQLTICASDYFGSRDGASCSQWQKKFIELQTQWERTEP